MLETLTTALSLAHAGHDHTFTPGGEWHHVVWIAAALAVVTGVAFRFIRKRGR